jgi:predicted phage gp36 major capsid-like protein
MDTQAQVWTAVVGSSGFTGVAVQLLALWREKKGWRADMEARLRKVESESPEALLKRLEQTEEFRADDKREIDRQLSRLRGALNVTMDALSKIQDRLGITAV